MQLKAIVNQQRHALAANQEQLAAVYNPPTTRSEPVCMALPDKFYGYAEGISLPMTSYEYFIQSICKVFEYPTGGQDVAVQLLQLCHGADSAADYTVKFQTLAGLSVCNKPVLKARFKHLCMSLWIRASAKCCKCKCKCKCCEKNNTLTQHVNTDICLIQNQSLHVRTNRPLPDLGTQRNAPGIP
ncbi:hypothetical protein Q7C36_005662 [Tachysurus vachellii]|uniref:Retrotransposon gag domain-containing protein n=1 Tax=Tachysurus vachellii TaxID=175792 RepID=A0AA88T3Y6_TACVA|nr:hypothetical protein Q7C36_005662 [Tachysurus vachellii]